LPYPRLDTRSGLTTKLLDCGNGCVTNEIPSFRTETWVACIDVDPSENWMVCGGGGAVTTAVWYLAVPSLSHYLPSSGVTHDVVFADGTIYTGGGTDAWLYHWDMMRKMKPRLPTTSKSIFSISYNTQSPKVVVACGTAPLLDVYTTLYDHKITTLNSSTTNTLT